MLKSWINKFFIISLELLLIAGALWFVAEKQGIKNPGGIIPMLEQKALRTAQSVENIPEKSAEVPFPALTDPDSHVFNWQYKDVNYSLTETLYQSVYEYVSKKLGIIFGQTTADEKFTLLPISCLGDCDHAPAMMINDELYNNLSISKIDELLEKYL